METETFDPDNKILNELAKVFEQNGYHLAFFHVLQKDSDNTRLSITIVKKQAKKEQ